MFSMLQKQAAMVPYAVYWYTVSFLFTSSTYRMDYLKKENLFASDVQKNHDLDERRRFKEVLQANRDKVVDGADLGLW